MKNWGKNLVLLLISIFVIVGLVEIGLRASGTSYPEFYEYDPYLGSRLRPGIKGFWNEEGGGYVSINSDGMRDVEHSTDKPPDALRIAVLGDSYAEAMQVNLDQTFWAMAQKQLESCDSLRTKKIEVLNFGVSGFGTSQELITLQHRVWKYSPDIVLLAFLTGNDISDNHPALKQKSYHPYHALKGDELVLDGEGARRKYYDYKKSDSWSAAFYRWRRDNLRVQQVISKSGEILNQWLSRADLLEKAKADLAEAELGLDDKVYKKPVEKVWKDAWDVTERVMVEMNQEIEKKGAKLFVVVLSNGVQVNPDSDLRVKYAERLGVKDLFYPDRRIEALCHREQIPILLLAPKFQEYASEKKVFLHGFGSKLGNGHWNKNGHALAGQLIADWLCRDVVRSALQ